MNENKRLTCQTIRETLKREKRKGLQHGIINNRPEPNGLVVVGKRGKYLKYKREG